MELLVSHDLSHIILLIDINDNLWKATLDTCMYIRSHEPTSNESNPKKPTSRPNTLPRRPQDASKTTPIRLPDGPRYPQNAIKTALNSPRHPKMLPTRLKTPKDASETPPDLDVGASRPVFLEVFTCKLSMFPKPRLRVGVLTSFVVSCHPLCQATPPN